MPNGRRIPDEYGRKLAVERERALAELAGRQHGVVALWQLMAIGFTARAVHRRVEAGRLHRVHRGVYAVGHRRLTRRGRWMAGVLACGRHAILGDRSAAHLRGLIDRSGAAEVISPRKVATRPAVRVRVVSNLTGADCTVVDGIPCASVPLTLLGLAAKASERLPGALARAEKHGALDLAAVDELLARSPRAAGRRALRDALGAYRLEFEWTDSELERRAFALFAEAGLPAPRVRGWIDVASSGLEVDFSWPRERLVVEVDGFGSHGDRAAFERDRRRDALLTAAGWRVLRFTWRQIVDDPAFVVATIRGALATAPAAGRP